jgi:diaminopimelate decarboxylase
MSAATEEAPWTQALRGGCEGIVPLSARLEPWQLDLCGRPETVAAWMELYGSPLNILDPSPLARNAQELKEAAARFGIDFKVFFARKANKALAFVDAAIEHGLGVDLASERELQQALARGVPSGDLVMTAAVKPTPLLELCLGSATTVAVDNEDELERLNCLAERSSETASIALRLAPSPADGRAPTRFGLGLEEWLDVVTRHIPDAAPARLRVDGVHFHLDGYAAAERVSALSEALVLIDALRALGHEPRFLDMGGGIPMSYLDSAAQWERFWHEHRRGLLGERPSLTFDGHGLGLLAHEGEILGQANVYPYHQALTRGPWLERILGATVELVGEGATVGEALRARGLQLRCEPGRSLLDGCGLTAARVEFRKRRADGTWLIGLAMNRTQCRSTSDDFLLDPLLIRPAGHGTPSGGEPIDGYLVGAYCIERELLTWRELRFARGVEVGDIVVFPNTAGYLMHILESSSHQIPLANNVILEPGEDPRLDAIHDPVA